MSTITVGLSKIAATTCASVLTAVSAWAFANSTASSERDPFHFAAVMAANAQARTPLVSINSAPHCFKQSPASAQALAEVCRKG